MKQKKKEGSKSINLALYFGLFVLFIIAVALLFKTIDTIRSSKFDGDHRFSIAVFSKKNTDVISVSPEEGSITKLTVENVATHSEFKELLIPVDSVITSKSELGGRVKSFYLKLLLDTKGIGTELTVIDLVRLAIFSNGVDSSKIVEKSVTSKDKKTLDSLVSTLFLNPTIVEENKTIQITNATNRPGLGSMLAKYISNMGGNVVLVNTASNEQKTSRIVTKESSYTVDKISNEFNFRKELSDTNSISDIHIVIGKDKENFFD